VPVPCFLLLLCFRKVTQEIFSELDKTKAEPPTFYRSFMKTEDEMEGARGWPCRGFVNRSAIEVGVWRFVEGGEHGGVIRDGGSTSLPSFRSRDGGNILRAAIIHYMATSARLQ
jgi:hypothetical protein